MRTMIEKALAHEGWKTVDINSPTLQVDDEVYVPATSVETGHYRPAMIGRIVKIERVNNTLLLDTKEWVDRNSRKGERIFVAPRQYLTLQSMLSNPGREATDPEGRTYFYSDGKLFHWTPSLARWYSTSTKMYESGHPLTKLKLSWKKVSEPQKVKS